MPSIALIDHLLGPASGPVRLASLLRALAWGRYLESHAGRIYAAIISAEMTAARAIADRLLAGSLAEVFTVRDVTRQGWAMLTDKAVVKGAVETLLGHGWIVVEPAPDGPPRGRPTERYRLNPRRKELPK